MLRPANPADTHPREHRANGTHAIPRPHHHPNRSAASTRATPPIRPAPCRASPRLFIPRATRLPHPSTPIPLIHSNPTAHSNRQAHPDVGNGAGCRPLCRVALPPGDAFPRAVTSGRPGQRATKVIQGHAGPGRHAYRHSRRACRRDDTHRGPVHHPGRPRAEVLPCHPCPGGGSHHNTYHACAGQGPGRRSSQAQDQGRGPRAFTTCQGHRACAGGCPTHRRGTCGGAARACARGTSRRASSGDQAHRGPRSGARQEEEVVQGQEEEEGRRSGPGRPGSRRQDFGRAYLSRRGTRAQRGLHRRRHRERRRKEHGEGGGRDPRGGAWRRRDARLGRDARGYTYSCCCSMPVPTGSAPFFLFPFVCSFKKRVVHSCRLFSSCGYIVRILLLCVA